MHQNLPRYAAIQRPDIQGLRAIAVLAVVFYHFGLPMFSGGFVGVDVFFVISGFLITRKLLNELDLTGKLEWWRFWGGRVKRLVPNATLTLLFALAAAAIFLPPYRRVSIGEDIAWAASFASNFHFATLAVDYFRANDPPSPVQHFWSLSVEEQFYFFLPVVFSMAAILWPPKRIGAAKVVLVCLALISFALSIRAISISQPSAFFQTQNRIWQLATGAMVGAALPQLSLLPKFIRAVGAYLGMAAILTPVVIFSDALLYPGYWALLPTIGAAAAIIGAPACLLDAGLSTKALTWIGDRSYSIYLWHWPMLAIAAERWPGNLSAKVVAAVLSAAFAYGAYRFVENPIRHSKAGWITPTRLVAAGVLTIVVTVLASLLLALAPAGDPSPARTAAIATANKDFARNYSDHCHLTLEETQQPPCEYGDLSASRTVALFGDSHSAQWFAPLVKAAELGGWKVLTRTKNSCPSADVTIWYPAGRTTYAACDTWRASVLKSLTDNPPDIAILANYSHYYGWIEDRDSKVVLPDPLAKEEWRRGLETTIRSLRAAGTRVIIVRDTPEIFRNYRDCLASSDDCSRPRKDALNGMGIDQQVVASFPSGVTLLDLSDAICDESACPAIRDGQILFQDNNHLTASFTLSLSHAFKSVLSANP